MQPYFDALNLVEVPAMTLCNPNQEQLYSLGNCFNTKISLKYNALSEFTFDLMESIQSDVDQNSVNGDVVDPAYAFLKAKRLVLIENFGYFQIIKVTENRDGKVPIKSAECRAWESELINKQINGFVTDAPLRLYDPTSIDQAGTFIGMILADTNWVVNSVSSSLWDIYRDFDISSSNVYNILMTSAETAYGCIFIFDNFDRVVTILSIDDATYDTDIFLSFDNLLKRTSFTEISEEIVTALDVYGGDGLDIRAVNPLGTNTIYNFHSYMDSDWMSNGLIAAIEDWMGRIDSNQALYSGLLTTLITLNTNLGVQQALLTTLQSELAALIETKKAKIEGKQDLTDINNQIRAKRLEITNKNATITGINNQIVQTTQQIVVINDNLSLTNVNNFTLAQQEELRPYIISNVYQNENIIKTEIMTPVELQNQAQELYDQAKTVLVKTSVPRYEFSVETANFYALKEYQVFTNELYLGSNITIENSDNVFIKTAVLQIDMSFDKLDDFNIVFSNRLRLDNGSFINSDLFNNVVNSASSVNFNSGIWNQYDEDKPNILNVGDVLDATLNTMINGPAQDITISSAGLIGKNAANSDQVWLTSNVLSFSDDNFETAKLALGRIVLPSGGTAYGLAAEVIVGNLLAGNALRISNSGGNFVLDQNGAVLTDISLTITASAAHPQSIIINPTQGILIKNKANKIVFAASGSGDITFSGTLSGANGDFSGTLSSNVANLGGLIIDANGLKTANGVNYIKNNGSLKWGGFSVDTSGNSVFSGNVSASSITGKINGNSQIQTNSIPSWNIASINADTIVSGTIQGISIYGSNISYGGTVDNPQVSMFGVNDLGTFRAQSGLQLYVEKNDGLHTIDSAIFMSNSNIALYLPKDNYSSSNVIGIGLGNNTVQISGILNLYGISAVRLAAPSGNTIGLSGTFPVNTPSGVKSLYILNGFVYRFQ